MWTSLSRNQVQLSYREMRKYNCILSVVSPKYISICMESTRSLKTNKPNPTQPKRMRSAAQLPPCRSSPPLPLLLRVPLRTSRYCRFDLSSPPPPSTSPLLRFPPPTPREPSDKHRCQCGGASPAPSSAPPRRRRDAAPPRPSDAPRRCLPSTGAPTETSAGSRRSRRRRRGRGSRSRSRR
jgi:hypothetical protein